MLKTILIYVVCFYGLRRCTPVRKYVLKPNMYEPKLLRDQVIKFVPFDRTDLLVDDEMPRKMNGTNQSFTTHTWFRQPPKTRRYFSTFATRPNIPALRRTSTQKTTQLLSIRNMNHQYSEIIQKKTLNSRLKSKIVENLKYLRNLSKEVSNDDESVEGVANKGRAYTLVTMAAVGSHQESVTERGKKKLRHNMHFVYVNSDPNNNAKKNVITTEMYYSYIKPTRSTTASKKTEYSITQETTSITEKTTAFTDKTTNEEIEWKKIINNIHQAVSHSNFTNPEEYYRVIALPAASNFIKPTLSSTSVTKTTTETPNTTHKVTTQTNYIPDNKTNRNFLIVKHKNRSKHILSITQSTTIKKNPHMTDSEKKKHFVIMKSDTETSFNKITTSTPITSKTIIGKEKIDQNHNLIKKQTSDPKTTNSESETTTEDYYIQYVKNQSYFINPIASKHIAVTIQKYPIKPTLTTPRVTRTTNRKTTHKHRLRMKTTKRTAVPETGVILPNYCPNYNKNIKSKSNFTELRAFFEKVGITPQKYLVKPLRSKSPVKRTTVETKPLAPKRTTHTNIKPVTHHTIAANVKKHFFRTFTTQNVSKTSGANVKLTTTKKPKDVETKYHTTMKWFKLIVRNTTRSPALSEHFNIIQTQATTERTSEPTIMKETKPTTDKSPMNEDKNLKFIQYDKTEEKSVNLIAAANSMELLQRAVHLVEAEESVKLPTTRYETVPRKVTITPRKFKAEHTKLGKQSERRMLDLYSDYEENIRKGLPVLTNPHNRTFWPGVPEWWWEHYFDERDRYPERHDFTTPTPICPICNFVAEIFALPRSYDKTYNINNPDRFV